MASTEHVPAWKRLGLKLKYAKDLAPQEHFAAQPASSVAGAQQPSKIQQSYEKKRRTTEAQDSSPAVKKVKTDDYENIRARHQPLNNGFPQEQTANDRFAKSVYGGRTTIGTTKTPQKIVFNDEGEASSEDQAKLSALTRKKSVTFTPETKGEDGASGQTFSKLWLSPTPTASTVTATPAEVSTPTKPPAKIASKPEPRSKVKDKTSPGKKSAKHVSEEGDHDQRKLCTKYLDQFHNDKANWKFNKSRQNDLVKHIWDTQSIPPSSNDALVAYIAGLQGAGPRQRILEGAVAILDPLTEKHRTSLGDIIMDTPESRRDIYEKAFQKQLDLMSSTTRSELDEEHLLALRLETEQAERAEALVRKVLWAELRPGQPDPDDTTSKIESEAKTTTTATTTTTQSSTATQPATTTSKRKNRKSRTAVDSSSESSSESSTDDESDSDSSED
ncbi:hypothetical protein AMS68_000766 [Peltaster fructicola]|uniref:WKF domain-containing protein n=1 Tax=Peltaster fructicola TaxID=286661 RepID=A0A6H0XKU1_9PEZI|nr:hypothetical protein AMS68_000766 [Peltaster fructicola]